MARTGTQTHGTEDRRKGAASLNWILAIVGVALVATVAAAVRHRQVTQEAAAAPAAEAAPAPILLGPTPVPAEVMRNLTTIPAATWTRAGVRGAAPPIFVGQADQAGDKPVVLYIGAGYCPYCAAARWSMITALARFGTFAGLTLSASSSVDVFPSTPTFSFHGASYASPYVELQAVELASEVLMANGHYQPLEEPTAEQESLIRNYDGPPYIDKRGAGGIPFVLVGGRYMWSGSPFNPQVLANQTQAAIAATLPDGSGPAAPAILSNANMFTATICAVDGNKPADVCSDPMIQAAIKALPNKVPQGS